MYDYLKIQHNQAYAVGTYRIALANKILSYKIYRVHIKGRPNVHSCEVLNIVDHLNLLMSQIHIGLDFPSASDAQKKNKVK